VKIVNKIAAGFYKTSFSYIAERTEEVVRSVQHDHSYLLTYLLQCAEYSLKSL